MTRALLTTTALMVIWAASPPPARSQQVRAPSGALKPPGSSPLDSDWLPTAGSPTLGPPTAKVTIVVFSDFQCPYCARLAGSLKRLERAFSGDIRIVFKHHPLRFHRQAFGAALAAMAAHDQGRFWEMHDLLFSNRRTLRRPDLERHAASLGLDLVRFREALDQRRHETAIRADAALALKLGAMGTPTSFVNGRRVRGAQPYAKLERMVREEIAAANELIGSGVDPAQIYRRLTESRRAEAKPRPRPRPRGRRYAFRRRRRRPRPPTYYPIPISAGDPCRGPQTALVTIVGFGGFQCPFTARAARTIRALQRAFPGQVRYCFKHYPLPFHRRGRPAAIAALEAHAQGRFWDFHDLLFRNTRALSRADLESYARTVGMDVARLRDALDLGGHTAALNRDVRLARRAGVRGTPTFFVNGRRVVGARPLSAFRGIVEVEIKRAEALLAGGTPRARLYQRLLRRGSAAP